MSPFRIVTDETARNKRMFIEWVSTVNIALCYSIKVQVEITTDGVLFYLIILKMQDIIVLTKP